MPDTDDAGWRAAVLNGRIILVGGYPNNDGFRFVYSVWNNTWASESFGGSLRKHAVVAFNNCIYVIGGAGTTQDPNAVTSFSPQQVFYVHTLFE